MYTFSIGGSGTDQATFDASGSLLTYASQQAGAQNISLTFSPTTGDLTNSTTNNPNDTSELTTFNPDGSSTTTDYTGPSGTGAITEIDQENANGTSQITTYNPGGSSTITYYSGLNATGSVTEIDQENTDGTSQITTYNPDGSSTTTTYSGPNGTGSITSAASMGTTITIQRTASVYSYLNPLTNGELQGFATFVPVPTTSGSVSGSVVLGLAGAGQEGIVGGGTFVFTNGQLTQWNVDVTNVINVSGASETVSSNSTSR